MTLGFKQVRALLLQLYPPGRLYDWSTPTSNVSRFLDGLTDAVKTFGYDVVDRLRRELNPATAIEKLVDWEEALGLDTSYTARNGTIAQRQAAVIGKLREFGALTLANARASLAPLLGYADPSTLVILETDRAKMRAAHTYSDGQPHPAGPAIAVSAYVSDGRLVSSSGAQIDLTFASAPASAFTVSLGGPSGLAKQWASASLGPLRTTYRLYAPEFAGSGCGGQWLVAIMSPAATGTVPALASWSLFVEGAGRDGLGGDLASWGAYLDPSLVGKNGVAADLDGARAAISRIKPAHTAGYLITSLIAIPDDPNSLPDACLPA